MTADELLTAAVRAGCVAAWGRPTDCLYPHCICSKATESETIAILRLALEAAELIVLRNHNFVEAEAIRALMPGE